MKILYNEDTITAISTPLGFGAIAVIRISGMNSINILQKIFTGKDDIRNFDPWKVYYGKIVDNDKDIDEVLVTIFRRPQSYTKDDMVEISCHGGTYITKRILELIMDLGARLAEPGEFTKRAFLNGRIDLSQAEAVADLIKARTESSLQTSLQQLKGYLSRKIEHIREELIESCSLLEIELDFSEEALEFINRENLISKLNHISSELNFLMASYEKGKIISSGVKLVIVGKPNVGKSSLLNALLKEDRAIVTDIPGTTRDSLEEQLDIKGILFRVVDTAGLIETDNLIEQQGIVRAQQHIDTANLIVHVLDGSEKTNGDDDQIIEQLKRKVEYPKIKIIAVINKIDLQKKIDIDSLYYKKENIPIIETSAKEFIGVQELEETLYHNILNDFSQIKYNNHEILITKLRHFEGIKKARGSIEKAIVTAKDNLSSEFITVDLRDALDSLGEIIGVVTSEEILNNIFEKFCIGK